MDASQLAALSGVITAIGTIIVGVLATRSKGKLDELGTAIKQRDEARADLEEEIGARSRERTEMQERHDAEIARKDSEIDRLNAKIDERSRRINKLDRMLAALYGYVARLVRMVIDLGGTPPPRPPEVDE